MITIADILRKKAIADMLVRTPSDLGKLLRARRKELGLDQQTLAARVGVSRLWIIEIEKGKPRAALGFVLRTLTALGLSLDVLADDRPRATTSTPAVPDIDAVVRSARKRS